ncbi:MAG TPA: adenylate/guanylate cyclase domain-containing protein, partial [Burkholderiaceae bacterium]|nr:adenylate/guanylate cyclase domain-containing protein [Burkholderiaceae bacterium]
MSELERWLEGLGLGAHAQAFAEQGIEFDLLPELGDDDLKALGVAQLGHRKRLLKAIVALNAAARMASEPGTLPPTARDAERRQLTVMFCDLVGSTALANRLDPEDLQCVIRSYHAAVTAAVAPYEGYIAQLLGDGVLVYFGFPRAHEDAAVRAVRAALAVLPAVAALKPHADVELQTRIGIATGLVVVGEVGAGTPAAEQSASGETPNLAARLQAHASPGQIVIADETRHLVGTAFALDPLGHLALKGFAAPVKAWRVLGLRVVASRFEAQHETALIEFIGRDSEVALLLERWALARDGEGQVVLLTGEAGIGKSRICQTLRERIAGDSAATALLQCSPYFTGSAFYPVAQHIERTAGIAPSDPPAVRAEKVVRLAGVLSDELLGSVLRMMGLPDGGRTPAASPQQEKAQTAQALGELLQRLAQQQPVLYLVEDAHWIDPSTEELIGQTIERLREARVLMVVTARPEYAPSWGSPAHLTQLRLSRLGQKQCAALVAAVTGGKPLPAEVLTEIVRKTDGVPLFVEELTKTVLQSGLLVEAPERYELNGPLPPLAIPATLQDSLMARLDRLALAKEVAQAGAVIGREFTRRLLGSVLASLPAPKLDAALDELVRSELVFRRGAALDATYTFKHALIRDTAYASMLKSQRVLRHAQIAAALEQTESAAAPPELLAHHHQEAGNDEAAVEHWSRAGELAARRSSSVEAQSHYRAAIALLARLEAGPPNQERELRLQILLAQALYQSEGFGGGAYEAATRAAHALARSLDRPDAYVQTGAALVSMMCAAGRLREGIETLEQMRPESLALLPPIGRARRAFNLGMARMQLGELARAWVSVSEALHELETDAETRSPLWAGADPMVMTLYLCSMVRLRQGMFDQAHEYAARAWQLAQELGHTHSKVVAQMQLGFELWCEGETAAALPHLTQAL